MQTIHRHTNLGISFFAPIWISVKDNPRHFKLVYNNNPNWEKIYQHNHCSNLGCIDENVYIL